MISKIRNGAYAGYKGKDYKAEKDFATGQISLLSRDPKDVELHGFHQIANQVYEKEVELDELDYLYSILTFAEYNGLKCQVGSAHDGEVILIYDGFSTNIKQLGFHPIERYVYEKTVQMDEIESIYEEKTPIWGFQGSE